MVTATSPTSPNPANKPLTQAAPERKRVPMSTPVRRMEAPEIPGFKLYWFLEENVPRAIQGGYEFVEIDELPINQRGIAASGSVTGSTDLGSRVSIIGNKTGNNGRPEQQFLMKIREEWYNEDHKVLERRNAQIMSGIFRDESIPGSENVRPEDRGLRYVKTALMNRPARKSKT